MARIRSIKPNYCRSKDVAALSTEARLFFILLWTEADDEGRLAYVPRQLVTVIFPWDEDYTPKDCRRWVDECIERKMIIQYSVGDQEYLQIVNFLKHQSVSKPSKSRLPAPPKELLPVESKPGQGALPECSYNPPGILPESSGSPPVVLHGKNPVEMELGSGSGIRKLELESGIRKGSVEGKPQVGARVATHPSPDSESLSLPPDSDGGKSEPSDAEKTAQREHQRALDIWGKEWRKRPRSGSLAADRAEFAKEFAASHPMESYLLQEAGKVKAGAS